MNEDKIKLLEVMKSYVVAFEKRTKHAVIQNGKMPTFVVDNYRYTTRTLITMINNYIGDLERVHMPQGYDLKFLNKLKNHIFKSKFTDV